MIYMLHSVGNTQTNWIYKYLSIKLDHIKYFFEYLNRKKVKTHFVKDLCKNNFILPSNEICLTFDDGYLDNYVYLFPLLKKYNIKATIFVNPEFVDNREIVRAQFENEVRIEEQDKALGFLSWKEMKEMEKSGLVDIQSHSMSHTWYYTGPKLLDFFSPKEVQSKKKWNEQYPWISWNDKPEQKSFTHNSNSYFSNKIGLPILENGRSLGIKRFFMDEEIENKMVEYAKENYDLFNGNWYSELKNKFDEVTKDKVIGRFETQHEMEERFWYELKNSKELLEQRLNKTIDILCWPGGAYNDVSLRISEEAGYLASTISSKESNKTFDNEDKKYKRIPRKPMAGNVVYKGKLFGTSFLKNILTYKFNPTFANSLLIKSEKLFRLVLDK